MEVDIYGDQGATRQVERSNMDRPFMREEYEIE
jgi:hypothetical protein